MSQLQALVFDTETTSLDFKVAEIIELGALSGSQSQWTTVVDQLYRPREPVSAMTSSITDITNDMLAHCEAFEAGSAVSHTQALLDQHDVCVAHNLFYDQRVLERYGISIEHGVCTMRMAKRVYPGLESYKLSYLRYWLDLPVRDFWRDQPVQWHRALADASVTALLFDHLVSELCARGELDDAQPLAPQILEWAAQPTLVTTMPFGKYRGQPLTEVPLDYWQWALQNMSSLQPELPEYDADFAASVAAALTAVLEDSAQSRSAATSGHDAGR